MAYVKFVFTTIDENTFEAENVVSYELRCDKDAPCDSLRLYFKPKETLAELVDVKAYCDSDLIFNGFVDVQKENVFSNDKVCYVYARSTASVLVDNQAMPCTYYSPTAYAIFSKNCRDFSFDCCLPKLISDSYYQVKNGCSCFDAINDFVNAVSGENVRITPDNKVTILNCKGKINLDNCDVINGEKIINRGTALSKVDYKIFNDNDYKYHRLSRFAQERKINRTIIKNLSAESDFQKEKILNCVISNANENYHTYRIELAGYVKVELMDCLVSSKLDFLDNVFVSSIRHSLDSFGEKTVILAYKKYDFKEISYVD